MKDQQDTVTRRFTDGKLSLDQYKTEMDHCTTSDGIATFSNLEDFRLALELQGFDTKSIEAIIQDEQPHFDRAKSQEEHGITLTLIQHFIIQEDGSYGMYPGLIIEFPDDMDDDLARHILREVILAQPDLSPRDKAQLGQP